MAEYERSVRVAAPLSEVWEFHSTERGLEALTPDWMHLRVDSVRGPDRGSDPEVLAAGSTVEVSVQPFGVGPRQEWVSEIIAREHDGTSAYFRDTMRDGPFEFWEHTHLFSADGEETVVTDSVAYEFPFGRVGDAVSPLAVVGFEPMFRFRHRRTRELLE